jgi:hypothetical protein
MVGNIKTRPPCSLYYVANALMVETGWYSLLEPTSIMPSGVARICTDVDTEKAVGLVRLLTVKLLTIYTLYLGFVELLLLPLSL